MYDFVIIHGSYGSPFENWFQSLYEELTNAGKNVLVPQMPCGEEIQSYANWKKALDGYLHLIDENTVFVGHSLAPAFIVDYLLEKKMKAKAVYFVAGFYGLINIADFDKVNSRFFIRKDLNEITKFVKNRVLFISKTDPYVPNELSDQFGKEIDAEIVYFEDAGHFNKAAGYTSFPLLKERLLKE